jgi:hypothetical protein
LDSAVSVLELMANEPRYMLFGKVVAKSRLVSLLGLDCNLKS